MSQTATEIYVENINDIATFVILKTVYAPKYFILEACGL